MDFDDDVRENHDGREYRRVVTICNGNISVEFDGIY